MAGQYFDDIDLKEETDIDFFSKKSPDDEDDTEEEIDEEEDDEIDEEADQFSDDDEEEDEFAGMHEVDEEEMV